MKRLVIVGGLIVFMLTVSLYSLNKVSTVRQQMDRHIGAVLEAAADSDDEKLLHEVDELSRYWKSIEHSLLHFIRHSHIDELTKSVARLNSLAAFGDSAELMAEISSIQWQIENLWYSELPVLDNIL